MRHSVLFVASVTVAVGVAASACDPSTVDGSAAPTSSAHPTGDALAEIFDSCTALTDSDIRSYGLDPATKAKAQEGSAGAQVGCQWNNMQTAVVFIIQDTPAKAFMTNPTLSGVTPITINGRQAYLAPYASTGDCTIALQVGNMSAVVGVFPNFQTREAGAFDGCDSNKAIAQKFETKLPK